MSKLMNLPFPPSVFMAEIKEAVVAEPVKSNKKTPLKTESEPLKGTMTEQENPADLAATINGKEAADVAEGVVTPAQKKKRQRGKRGGSGQNRGSSEESHGGMKVCKVNL